MSKAKYEVRAEDLEDTFHFNSVLLICNLLFHLLLNLVQSLGTHTLHCPAPDLVFIAQHPHSSYSEFARNLSIKKSLICQGH